ncbi:hypothetical protein FH972_003457 [Carpinus fangiana]|uniref:Uncharacterized protein n=1 Tax=Carpinus fangiana TaxID=176857 RepID=A0A5N6QI14_9ROSI|nr:hypothetical protein FH972_003457 [Carpinus fangiana]
MKKSPIHPRFEMSAYGSNRFDPHVDFSQFLAEARHHARGVDLQSSSLRPEENGHGKSEEEEKKRKKSWKNNLFSWWKTNRKNKPPQVEPESNCYNHIPIRRRLLSGPIYGSGMTNDGRHRSPTSGPLTGLFNPTKTSENEIPYTSLHQLESPRSVHTYGPLYLVT